MGNKGFFLLLFCCFTLIFSFTAVQENTPPKVEITLPTDNVKLEWNTLVPYNIAIVDQEDGNSEYDEISINEVVLTITQLSDTTKVKKYVEEEVGPRSEKLSLIAASNCFSCHQAKDRHIGPSFDEIANKYSPILGSRAYLTQKIRQGSSGIWNDEIMPGQPELEKEKIIQILDWIFKNAQDPNYTFYAGTEGAFKTREKQEDKLDKGVFVLHALYTDHGINKSLSKSKKGTHTIVINSE